MQQSAQSDGLIPSNLLVEANVLVGHFCLGRGLSDADMLDAFLISDTQNEFSCEPIEREDADELTIDSKYPSIRVHAPEIAGLISNRCECHHRSFIETPFFNRTQICHLIYTNCDCWTAE
jgi:hypothetical protein